MASLVRRTRPGCINCLAQQWVQVRNMTKLNTRKPRPRSVPRRIFEAVTEPILYRPPVEIKDSCGKLNRVKLQSQVNPYEDFLKRNCKKILEENRFIAICHKQPVKERQIQVFRNKLEPKGFELIKWPSNKLMREVVTDTKYQSLIPLLQSHNIYITSKDPNVKELLALTRKMPEIIIMGALYEDKLFSREELIEFSKKPNIEQMRGELVSILNMAAGGRTSSFLSSHQQTLARNLDQYVKQCRGDSNHGNSSSSDSESSSDSDSD